jgi:SPP1 family predicted phage head-tail adaptor
MPILRFNRKISLERKAVVQDEMGQPVEIWTVTKTTMADRRDINGVERMRASQELATRTSIFTIRWFPDLNAASWRIAHEGLLWDIEGLAEPRNTRRQFWEITATASGS